MYVLLLLVLRWWCCGYYASTCPLAVFFNPLPADDITRLPNALPEPQGNFVKNKKIKTRFVSFLELILYLF